jgi:hypothetical protein
MDNELVARAEHSAVGFFDGEDLVAHGAQSNATAAAVSGSAGGRT